MKHRWMFRDDGSMGEEISGMPNGFREFVIAAAEQILQPAGRYRNLPPLIECLIPNEDQITKYHVDDVAQWPGMAVRALGDPE